MKYSPQLLLILCAPLLAVAGTNTSHTLEARMHKIVIPRVEFRDANPAEVFAFLRDAANATPPEVTHSIGLIHVNTNRLQHRVRHIYGTEDGTPLDVPMSITLNLRRVTMYEAFRQITATMGIDFRVSDNDIRFYTREGKRIVLIDAVIDADRDRQLVANEQPKTHSQSAPSPARKPPK